MSAPNLRASGTEPVEAPVAVSIASCPEHGLHGARQECFICSGEVDQVAYVRADKVHALADERDALRAELGRLHSSLRGIADYAKTASRTSRFASVACGRLAHVAGDAAQALNESKGRLG